MQLHQVLAKEMNWDPTGIENAIKLFEEGMTLPFIARYRKDLTRNLDDEQLLHLQKRYTYLVKLEEEKASALIKLQELGILDDVFVDMINQCSSISDVKEIMAPYRQKRKTKASIAREKGLQPLANLIMGKSSENNPFVNKQPSMEEVQGAKHIIAEESVAHPQMKREMEKQLMQTAIAITWKKEDIGGKYTNLENIDKIPKRMKSHQILAMMRAENEEIVRIKFDANLKGINKKLLRMAGKPNKRYTQEYNEAVEDGIKRLLTPRAETSVRAQLIEYANQRAIKVFETNLENLLLTAPLSYRTILAMDPGYRTGCKLAVIDLSGKVLEFGTAYLTGSKQQAQKAETMIAKYLEKFKINLVAIGNGTASIETREFIQNLLEQHKVKMDILVVSEDGASVYSASKIAREEFPTIPVEIRGAISIGRRVQDPLAEYVKIDPKSLGVGQYQHDVDQKMLSEALEFVMSKIVNKIGINLQTASKQALSYISGISEKNAEKIIKYREDVGFSTIKDLLKVQGIGKKTYQQAAGFLRYPNSKDKLDSTMIHPDYYSISKSIIEDLGYSIDNWVNLSIEKRKKLLNNHNFEKYQNKEIGQMLLQDIREELEIFGQDPRGEMIIHSTQTNLREFDDLKEGEIYSGMVGNVVDFGAFVDLGIKENGLIHISQISDGYVSDIHQHIRKGDRVRVEVLTLDNNRKRIGLKLIGIL